MNKRHVGTEWEKQAEEFLAQQGIEVLEHSFRCRMGEIDLIGRDCGELVFFEVKYRSRADYGLAEEAVDRRKQRIICKVSDYYRCIRQVPADTGIRFDVLALNGGELHWYRNAFPYQGKGF